jgi:hypothetical protein
MWLYAQRLFKSAGCILIESEQISWGDMAGLWRTGCRLAPVRQGGPGRPKEEFPRRYQRRNRLDVLQHTQCLSEDACAAQDVHAAAACKEK